VCFKEQVGIEQHLALKMGPVYIVQKVKDIKTVICVRLLSFLACAKMAC